MDGVARRMGRQGWCDVYDNSQRSMWLEQAYTAICKSFGFEAKNILIGASYPPAGARGALERVRPADFDTQWSGNDNEKDGFLSIHPMAFKTPLDAMKAILWALGRTHHGVRHGATKVGLHKEPDATITADAETQAKLDAIHAEIGDPPAGFAEPFPIRQRSQRGRMVTFACHCSGGKVYRTGTKLPSGQLWAATCNVCNHPFLQV